MTYREEQRFKDSLSSLEELLDRAYQAEEKLEELEKQLIDAQSKIADLEDTIDRLKS